MLRGVGKLQLAVSRGAHEIEYVRYDLGNRIVGHDVAVIVAELIARRRRRYAAIVGARNGPQAAAIVTRKSFAGTNVVAPVRVVLILPDVPLIVTAEAIAILVAETIFGTRLLPIPFTAIPHPISVPISVTLLRSRCTSEYK